MQNATCVTNVKFLNSTILSKNNLLTIRANNNFKKTFKRIRKSKKEFLLVEKPKSNQMFAVLISRLLGKKFLWIQNFENPPIPNFWKRLLLNQADEIFVSSRKEAAKLNSLGIDKPRKRIKR